MDNLDEKVQEEFQAEYWSYIESENIKELMTDLTAQCFASKAKNPKRFIADYCSSKIKYKKKYLLARKKIRALKNKVADLKIEVAELKENSEAQNPDRNNVGGRPRENQGPIVFVVSDDSDN